MTKPNRPFSLTDKEIDAIREATDFLARLGYDVSPALQRALDKMFQSQWYSKTEMFSPEELDEIKAAK